MKKTICGILGKVSILLLMACILISSVNFLKSQTTQAHENPITDIQNKQNIPILENTKTQVDQDILDLDSKVSDAENTQTDGLNVPTSKDQIQQADDGNETKKGDENPNEGEGKEGNVPGGAAFNLPADGNYFFVNLIDVKDPYKIDDPRCYYKITHIYPQLSVEKVVFYNNGKITPYYADNPNKGFINLVKGENWLKVRVSYRLPDGTLEIYERAVNPPMVRLQDPLDINFSDTNLRYSYDDPDISFYVNPKPEHAHVQVFINDRLAPKNNKGNYNVTLNEGENKITFKGSAIGFKDTELIKKVEIGRASCRERV